MNSLSSRWPFVFALGCLSCAQQSKSPGPPDAGFEVLPGHWEGQTSLGLPVSFDISAERLISNLSMTLKIGLTGGTCTAAFQGNPATIAGDKFQTTLTATGISINPDAQGSFDSPSSVSGTYTGPTSGYVQVTCGNTYTVGLVGSISASGRFSANWVALCGNGIVEGQEECDSTPNCDGNCQRIPVCGDRFVDAPEGCDDGNTVDGDGCSSTCQKEVRLPKCGDGFVDPPEACDDGNTVDGDGCSSTCVKDSRHLSYPSDFPAIGQHGDPSLEVTYQVSGLSSGASYKVSVSGSASVGLYVWRDSAFTQTLCSSVGISGNQNCSLGAPGDTIYISVRTQGDFVLDIARPGRTPDAGINVDSDGAIDSGDDAAVLIDSGDSGPVEISGTRDAGGAFEISLG